MLRSFLQGRDGRRAAEQGDGFSRFLKQLVPPADGNAVFSDIAGDADGAELLQVPVEHIPAVVEVVVADVHAVIAQPAEGQGDGIGSVRLDVLVKKRQRRAFEAVAVVDQNRVLIPPGGNDGCQFRQTERLFRTRRVIMRKNIAVHIGGGQQADDAHPRSPLARLARILVETHSMIRTSRIRPNM